MKSLLKILMYMFSGIVLFVLATNIWVIQSTKNRIYDESELPSNNVALVLGTSKQTTEGNPNRYFTERMSAAAQLYNEGKIKHILVSGDNRSQYYNEPRDMYLALEDLNIPEPDISLDFAGLRTLDSVVRAKEVFGQDSITIVTQAFHCYRALFIAQKFNLQAVAYAADDENAVGNTLAFREIFARSIAVTDLYLLNRKPKYLGEKIDLPISE